MEKDSKKQFFGDYLVEFETAMEGCEWYANNLRFLKLVKATNEFKTIVDAEFKKQMEDKYDCDLKQAIVQLNEVIKVFGWRHKVFHSDEPLDEIIKSLDKAREYMSWLISTMYNVPSTQKTF